jgi:DNA helicase-2/ATP-dependent DNA helicase PcrA
VFVVGDDDQAIYGWRGAEGGERAALPARLPGASTLRLEQNYRSSSNILNAANAVIAHNPDRLGKQLWTDAGEGDPIDLYAAYNEIDEARFVVERIRQWVRDGGSHGECAILYRSNAQSRAFEEGLLAEQIPYRVYGGMRFFERAEIKDTLAYLRLVANRADDAAFERCGQHALPAASASARWTKCAARRAKTRSTCGSRAPHQPGHGARAAFAQCARRFPAADRSVASGNRRAALAGKDRPRALPQRMREHYANESKGQLDSRTDNLDELVSVASRFVHGDDEESAALSELVAFLSYAALEAGEGQAQAGEDGVQLMTLHSAKGLEFPAGVPRGLEEGLFPNTKSQEEPGRLEEERRLAYVGITARGRSSCSPMPRRAASTARTCTAFPRASCARSPAR